MEYLRESLLGTAPVVESIVRTDTPIGTKCSPLRVSHGQFSFGGSLVGQEEAMTGGINPLRPNSDLCQTSHCNIKGLSVSEVMRIENRIT